MTLLTLFLAPKINHRSNFIVKILANFIAVVGSLGANAIGGDALSVVESQLFVPYRSLRTILTFLKAALSNTTVGYLRFFDVLGYNHSLRARLKRRVIRMRPGYSLHKIFILLPHEVRIFKRKRRFALQSGDPHLLDLVANFVIDMRNLYPYKLRGFVMKRFKQFPLKVGKTVKYR
jgi:hypothetical protein